MKVINTDLGAFLRRNELLEVRCYFKDGRFYAATASVTQHATNLADALDHVQEEYRRRANDMAPIRDNGKGTVGDVAHAPAPNSLPMSALKQAAATVRGASTSTLPSISQAGQQAYQQQQAASKCSNCGGKGYTITGTPPVQWMMFCPCGATP